MPKKVTAGEGLALLAGEGMHEQIDFAIAIDVSDIIDAIDVRMSNLACETLRSPTIPLPIWYIIYVPLLSPLAWKSPLSRRPT